MDRNWHRAHHHWQPLAIRICSGGIVAPNMVVARRWHRRCHLVIHSRYAIDDLEHDLPPTIGREWMVGSEGTVVESVDPEGIVNVGGADWRARTNRATPVNAGDTIKVVAIDGITLEVEPLEGAARDYRR